jgi:hypothetical protein
MAAKIRLDSAGNVLGMGKLMGLELNKYLFFTCPMVVEHEVENEQKNKDSQPNDDPVSLHIFILCATVYNSREERQRMNMTTRIILIRRNDTGKRNTHDG